MASAGCRKNAGVPVLESVAAIFRQMMPDLPIPVTITRPRQSRSRRIARSKRSSRRSSRARIAAASVWSTLRANARSIIGGGDAGDSGMARGRTIFDNRMDGKERRGQRLEPIEMQGVLCVTLGLRRIVVDFEKDTVHAGRDACGSQWLDVFGLSCADAVVATRQLQAV